MFIRNHARRVGIAAAIGVLALAAVPLTSQAAPAKPDALHYNITESDCGTSPSCFTTANVDIFPSGADDSVAEIALPFPVYVYGVKHTTAWVSSNGNVQFKGPGNSQYVNSPLPTNQLDGAAVAPYWDDLVVDGSGSGTGVFDRNVGGTEFVISWRGFEYNNTANTVRAEVIFFKNNRNIQFNYISTNPGDGESATIGVQKAAGGPASEWSYDSSGAAFDGMRLTLAPVS
jgi:hypothetical protein